MKKNVAIICGGESAEHEISLISGKNIYQAVDREKFDVVLFSISREGKWYHSENADWLPNDAVAAKDVKVEAHGKMLGITPGDSKKKFFDITTGNAITIDAIFPILHGQMGEDGSIQGLMQLLDLPYVGCGTLSSAVGMDKDVMKRLLADAGITTAKSILVRSEEQNNISYEQATKKLGPIIFIKPACQGSSVGVSKVKNADEFKKALAHSFSFDDKILIEEAIKGRELECAVLGNEQPQASRIGEIKPRHEFYSYEAKYVDDNGAELIAPADLTTEQELKLKSAALDTYKALCCEGMARVDMFLTDSGKIYVNEINTLPGFTRISMYPRLWKETGLNFGDLITKLINLALERHSRQKLLKEKSKK